MSGENERIPADYVDLKGILISAFLGLLVGFLVISSPVHITDDGVQRKEGSVKSVSCGGKRSEQIAEFLSDDGYRFYIFVKDCDRYVWSDFYGVKYISYFLSENPSDPIKVDVGGIIGYQDGVSYNDILAAVLLSFGGFFLSLMLYVRTVMLVKANN